MQGGSVRGKGVSDMRAPLALALVLVPAVAWSWTTPEAPPISIWDGYAGAAVGPTEVPGSQFTTVRIDSMAAYIRYLFEMKQGVILPEGEDYWFFFAYNDNHSHVRTKIFKETDVMNEPVWNVTDVYEWTGAGTLRYVCPTAYWDGSVRYPEMTINPAVPTINSHFIDEGGINVGMWTPPMEVVGLQASVLATEAGPDNVIYCLAIGDSHWFWAFDGGTGTGAGQIVGADWCGQGYENSQLLYRDGLIVVAAGAYRTSAYTDPSNPLLVVYRASTDGGESWSDNVWLDQAVIVDMPGTLPGIQGHWSNSFFDGLIDDDGDLHFMCAITDSGCWNNAGYVHGLYDVHQDNGVWTASLVTDGADYMDAGVPWNPRSLLDGDTYLHAPSLAWNPYGIIFATWADIGYIDQADSSFTFDIWFSWSADEGNTWHTPHRVTDTPEWNESFPRLMPTTTEDYVYVLTMYEWADGPMDMVVFCPLPEASDPSGSGPAVITVSSSPNPLARNTVVSFSLASACPVEAAVYSAKGELVETLVRGSLSAGNHSLVWNAGDAAPGLYVCRVVAGKETVSARMVLIR
jgi:hypothetical protein